MSLRGSLAFGLVVVLAAVLPGMAAAAPNRGLATRSKRSHTITGIVVAVKHDKKSPGTGHIRIRRVHHRHHRRNGQPAAAARAAVNAGQRRSTSSHMKFHVNKATRFEHVVLGKNNNTQQVTQVSFQNVHKGERVRIHPASSKQHHAREVDILTHHRRRHRSTSAARLNRSHHYGNSLVHNRSRHPRSTTTRVARTTVVRNPLLASQVAKRHVQQQVVKQMKSQTAKARVVQAQVKKKMTPKPAKKPVHISHAKPKAAPHPKPRKR
jgi:glycogen debranching enzyme